MSTDLLLLPITLNFPHRSYALTTLELERSRDLWKLIRALPASPVPARLETFVSTGGTMPGEHPSQIDPKGAGHGRHQGETQADGYGEPLTCAPARDLAALAAHEPISNSAINRAVWSYLAALPGDMLVVLYWW